MIMLKINKIDHVGIRVREKSRAIDFYQIRGADKNFKSAP